MVKFMIYDKLKQQFNNSTDLIKKEVGKIQIIYLESLCSSDKINEYILKNITLNKDYIYLKNIVSGPNVVFIDNYDLIEFYLLNGFAFIYDGNDMLVCEVKGDLYRGVMMPTSETAVNGPKDSFNESIVMNLGLIKRRIKSDKLVNDDYVLGRQTKLKVSLLYIKGIAKEKLVKKIQKKMKNIDVDGIIDIEILSQIINKNRNPMPTIMKTERPDKVSQALLEGKVILIADNSPYALIMPAFFVDFINPQGDHYVKDINVNVLKIIRFFCLILSITLPALYISIVNYNPETIPLKLLLSFQASRSGVPFPSSFEAIFMILLCTILRESDIRFPSTYGSSISILGALILGEAAVSANIASPIMIIIIGITFITGLIFSDGELINGLRYFRFLLLILAIMLGLYGLLIGVLILFIHLASSDSFGEPYLFPLVPTEKSYFFKTVLKKSDNPNRSKLLSNNTKRSKI